MRKLHPFVLSVASGLAAPACCVAAASRVRTPDGEVPIDRLRVGDAVLSFDVERSLFVPTRVRAVRSAMRPCLSLRSGASTLVCTPDHPLYMPDSTSYEHAVSATPGRRLVHARGPLANTAAVDAVAAPGGLHRVVDITVDSELHNFVAEGVLVHNKDYGACAWAQAAPPIITLDDEEPSQRVVVRACRDGRDVIDPFLEVYLDVRTAAEGADIVRVAAYFDIGSTIESVDGSAPFDAYLSPVDVTRSCADGIPLVVERLDDELSIAATVSLTVDVEACDSDEEVTIDVEAGQ